MELRELAERILFSTRLEEKLDAPVRITDERPGRAWEAPLTPGRPVELRFKRGGTGERGQEFPGWHRLSGARERGQVLHFFANHELLATELMALVLLRFPEAPAAFRRGVLQTMREEQEHTRLYLERMRQCGVEFGQLPVSGFFWRAVSTMERPIDYVARLSLTFEQANLDFCHEFANAFQAAGDVETARLLARIYQDEIAHVGYGLRWFRRWKDPKQSDWEAYRRHLSFPLSPQRAKGPTLNVGGRRAAGLDAEFIRELDVYARSKGRTPSVFWFNPLAEGHIAFGKGFTPVRHQARLVGDLAALPQFLCRQDDVVLAERPSVTFLQSLKRAGFALPEFMPAVETSVRELSERKLGVVRPWAWGPDSVEFLGPLLNKSSGGPKAARGVFDDRIAQLYAKAWSAKFLRGLLLEIQLFPEATDDWLCSEAETGRAVSTLAEALEVIEGLRRRGQQQVLVKQSFGLAGHNALRLWESELLPAQRRWLARSLESGRAVVLEPWLERVVDFSIQLEMHRDAGLSVLGYTGLRTDKRGQYRGNWAEPDFAKKPPVEVLSVLRTPGAGAGRTEHRVRVFYEWVLKRLAAEFRALGYEGPAGLDAFVYRDATGNCRLKPVVELNPRYTMGRLLVELMRRAAPGTRGELRLIGQREMKEAGFDTLTDYAAALMEKSPVRQTGQPVARISEGAMCLNDPARAEVCLAVWEVSDRTRTSSRWPARAR
jgi:uncharacterized ferritin-like protein (DUF455 family)